MAEIKVSQLPEASEINDNDLIMIVQNNVNKKITKENCKFASGDEVAVSDTEPTGEESESVKLWINPEETPSGSLNPITNEYSIATDKGYSCKYINDRETYSTSETLTGQRWVNGKPIYRKVISGVKTDGDTLATGVDTLVLANGTIAVSTYPRLIPYFEMYMNATYIGTISLDGNSVKVAITEAGQSATRDCEITLEYTKTTD